MKTYLVTGAAGFIGYHLCATLLAQGEQVLGVDNLSEYYNVQLKRDRLDRLQKCPQFRFQKLDLADAQACRSIFESQRFDRVLHMAAQVGVRYSLEDPQSYIESNLCGFANVLEGCRTANVKHFVYASSSSVYGANKKLPFAVTDRVDHPVSLYAATKKANELMAHSYSHLYQIPTTGLRFFTVYGPWGRPDMAIYKFTDAICSGRPIDVYNKGQMRRDFTYIDDVVEAVLRVAEKIPQVETAMSCDSDDGSLPDVAPYRLYNVGNHAPVDLPEIISLLENCLGQKAIRNCLPMQSGEMVDTYANTDTLQADVGFCPSTPIDVGISRFVAWYQQYHA